MSVSRPLDEHQTFAADFLQRGISLFSQQIWCWGRDILRPEGNWLLEMGFDRQAAPADREQCSSVYSLECSDGRRVTLRGFGVFYGEDRLGGVFLPRYVLRPRYTSKAKLECPPWSDADLPELGTPTQSQRDACLSLTLGLIDWICGYETQIMERLGVEYRRSTLATWNNGKRQVVPAEEMADTWQSLGVAAAQNSHFLL